ncbi:MAG: hypothetical protein LJE64_03445 [Desulfofustis sp.]|jgi:hypothetical protein|nr:hypothetical protein [Desulfofustis sp.]
MSYNYLLDLYNMLYSRVDEIDVQISAQSRQDSRSIGELSKLRGRRDCLVEFHSMLKKHYDRKLPRRLQNQVQVIGKDDG